MSGPRLRSGSPFNASADAGPWAFARRGRRRSAAAARPRSESSIHRSSDSATSLPDGVSRAWAGRDFRSRRSASARGPSADPGARWTTRSRCATLHAAIDSGVNFIDTADVYGDGRSERLVARLRRERPGETIYVATKAGRRLPPQTVEGYNRANLTAWVDRSLHQSGGGRDRPAAAALSAVCGVRATRRVYGILDDLVAAGKIRHYGVSVERVDEALAAIRHPGREDRADHLQHVPPEAGGTVLPGGRARNRSASSRACRWPAAC